LIDDYDTEQKQCPNCILHQDLINIIHPPLKRFESIQSQKEMDPKTQKPKNPKRRNKKVVLNTNRIELLSSAEMKRYLGMLMCYLVDTMYSRVGMNRD
jgi:hypothetical protein